MSRYPQLVRITDAALAERVKAAAKEDGHRVIAPTHAVVKGGELVGAWSMAAVPLAMVWHHAEAMGVRDSLMVKLAADAAMGQLAPPGTYWLACDRESPLHGQLERSGYAPVWPTDIFVHQPPEV